MAASAETFIEKCVGIMVFPISRHAAKCQTWRGCTRAIALRPWRRRRRRAVVRGESRPAFARSSDCLYTLDTGTFCLAEYLRSDAPETHQNDLHTTTA